MLVDLRKNTLFKKIFFALFSMLLISSCSSAKNTANDLKKNSGDFIVFEKPSAQVSNRKYPRGNKKFLALNNLKSKNSDSEFIIPAENKDKYKHTLIAVRPEQNPSHTDNKAVNNSTEKKPSKMSNFFKNIIKTDKGNKQDASKDELRNSLPKHQSAIKPKAILDLSNNSSQVASKEVSTLNHSQNKLNNDSHLKKAFKSTQPIKKFPSVNNVPPVPDKFKDSNRLKESIKKDIDELHKEMSISNNKPSKVKAGKNISNNKKISQNNNFADEKVMPPQITTIAPKLPEVNNATGKSPVAPTINSGPATIVPEFPAVSEDARKIPVAPTINSAPITIVPELPAVSEDVRKKPVPVTNSAPVTIVPELPLIDSNPAMNVPPPPPLSLNKKTEFNYKTTTIPVNTKSKITKIFRYNNANESNRNEYNNFEKDNSETHIDKQNNLNHYEKNSFESEAYDDEREYSY
jgi:hypothetical protein